MIGRCGFQCSRCPAFADNNRTFADQAAVSAGWYNYFGIEMSPENIRCRGCTASRAEGDSLPERGCPIRPCVEARGMDTCAQCDRYPCATLEARLQSIDAVIVRFRGALAHDEYERFIAPYDARATLEALRRSAKGPR